MGRQCQVPSLSLVLSVPQLLLVVVVAVFGTWSYPCLLSAARDNILPLEVVNIAGG